MIPVSAPGRPSSTAVEIPAPGGVRARVWTFPTGTTGVLDVDGDTGDVAELLWSVRAAQVPSTRALVVLDGEGPEGLTPAFEAVHRLVEAVASDVTASTGVEAGPIEVLVLRPGSDPADIEPVATTDGFALEARHAGGADVRLTLTVPPTAPTDAEGA